MISKNGWSAFMFAADLGDNSPMREIFLFPSVLMESVVYLQAGLHVNASSMSQHRDSRKSTTDWLSIAVKCGVHQIYASKFTLDLLTWKTIKTVSKIKRRRPLEHFIQIRDSMSAFLFKFARNRL